MAGRRQDDEVGVVLVLLDVVDQAVVGEHRQCVEGRGQRAAWPLIQCAGVSDEIGCDPTLVEGTEHAGLDRAEAGAPGERERGGPRFAHIRWRRGGGRVLPAQPDRGHAAAIRVGAAPPS
jgi:hypothetical protein